MIDGETGVLVTDESAAGLGAALRDTDFHRFDPVAIRANAERFSAASFREKFSTLVRELATQC